MTFLLILISALLSLGLGLTGGYLLRKTIMASRANSAEKKAEEVLLEAKNKQQEILLEAKEKALKLIDEAKQEEKSRRTELNQIQDRLSSREVLFDKKLLELEEKQLTVLKKAELIEAKKAELEELKQQEIVKLQDIAKLSTEEALNKLLARAEADHEEAIISRMRKLEQAGSDALENKAKHLLSIAIQRVATNHYSENLTTSVELPSDEMKGRIIGKEGRNIKVIEKLTGTEIVVDETPLTIMVSGFSPIRRHIARRALEILIQDGRIHPGRIEEAVESAKRELALDIKKAGEDALYQMGITGFDPKLVQILGRLKYRTSYGQNQLQHALEVANIAVLIGRELGADINVLKKGGILHDIGKAVDHEVQGGHPEIGYNIMKKFGLPEEIAYMSIAHHEDRPHSLEGVIMRCADAISGGRPGARRDSYEQYVQKLEDLERIATSFEGVEKAYAIQAGREIRAFVIPERLGDMEAYELAKNIATRIESEMQYPGEIRVTVIRETRITEYAR